MRHAVRLSACLMGHWQDVNAEDPCESYVLPSVPYRHT